MLSILGPNERGALNVRNVRSSSGLYGVGAFIGHTAELLPGGAGCPFCVELGGRDKVIVFGGQSMNADGSYSLSNTIHVYIPGDNMYSIMEAANSGVGPAARMDHTSVRCLPARAPARCVTAYMM